MSDIRVEAPDRDDSELGPLADHRAVDKVQRLVDDAVARGALVRDAAPLPPGRGHYTAPTVLDHVPTEAAIMREEVFGPVLAIHRFSTEAEGIATANATEHGLAAYLITSNIDRARRVASRLQTGMVGINRGLVSDVAAPFGGVKQSGLGREGGPEGLQEYQQIKYLSTPGLYV